MDRKTAPTDSNDRVFAALAYVWVVSLFMFLLKRDSDYVQFHAKQGLVLFLVEILGWLIPFFGWLIVIIAACLAVLGLWNALNGNRARIPVVADLADRIKI